MNHVQLTLVQVRQEGVDYIKRYEADEPFVLPNNLGVVTHLELLYDMSQMNCELHLNPGEDQLDYSEPYASVFIYDNVYPTVKNDKWMLENLTNKKFKLDLDVEDFVEELDILEY